MPGRIIVAGGTGYVGRHLLPALKASGHEVIVLTRHLASGATEEIGWDGKSLGLWQTSMDGAEAVINLSGMSVGKHWSAENKLAIQESRILSTRVIGDAIMACANPPKVWLNASATGYYGDRGDEVLKEDSPPGSKGEFLVDLCVAWEDEVARAETPSTRKAVLRTGVVFGSDSLAFKPIYRATQFFLGGHLGSGRQYMSWIHVEDLVSIYIWALQTEVSGPINAVSEEPVPNADLMRVMRAIMRRPWAPPVPAFMLKLITAFGGPEASLILDSERVVAEKAKGMGFEWKYPRLREALVNLVMGG